MNHPFKLKNAALLMALAAVYPMTVHSAAGVAQFAIGDVSVRRGPSATPLAKGQPINPGDNIVTGAGQAQLRFTDGGLVSLAPNTQFNIDRYVDENDTGKDTFAVSFLRGSMRAISGLIGKRKNENYKVTTSTATIGIRGSAWSGSYNGDGSLDVSGEQDEIIVCTNAGCVTLIVGESVKVTDNNSMPSRLIQRSNVPPLVPRQDLFVPENPPAIEPPVLASAINGVLPGVSAIFVGNGSPPYAGYLLGGPDPSTGRGTFVNGLMTTHVSTPNQLMTTVGGTVTLEQVGSGSSSFGTVGSATDPAFMGWGYWESGRVTQDYLVQAQANDNGSTYDLENVHYIVGRPTPQAQLPVTGVATYSLIGGTRPTASYNGSSVLVGTLVGASLIADFSSASVYGFVNTEFTKNGDTVPVQIRGRADMNGDATFSGSNYGTGFFEGFFSGAGASRAGLTYGIYDYTVGDVRGAAVFLNTGGIDAFSGLAAQFASADDNHFDYSPRARYVYDSEYEGYVRDLNTGTAYFAGNQMLLQDDGEDTYGYSGGSTTVFAAQSAVSSFGSLGNPADADFIGWGYWAQGDMSSSSYGGISNLAGVHYIVGRPTPEAQMPMTGTARYDLAGGTAPTAFDSQTGAITAGTLVSAGLNVDFGYGGVNAFINTQFTKGGQTVPVQISGVGWIDGSTFYSDSDYSTGWFNGFFVGESSTFVGGHPNRAGLIYGADDDTMGYVRGAAAFQKNGSGEAFTDQNGMVAMFASGDGLIFDDSPRPSGAYGGTAYMIGNQLYEHDSNSYSGSSNLYTASPVTNSGALGNAGDADFIGWGYWAKGQSSGYAGNSSLANVHYLVGRPTPVNQMPTTGTADYVLSSGTAPTATMGSTTIVGSLVSASLTANFGSGTVDATINTQFTKNNVVVPVSVTDLAFISGSRFSSAGCGNGTVSGFFTGNLAARAGVIYGKDDATVGRVRGAAGFTQANPVGLSVGGNF